MARKVGQIVGRGPRTWLVRVYNGRDPVTKKRKYLNQTIHGGLRDAQAHLNKILGERDRGRNLDSSKQTLNQYLDRWLEVCAKPRLRARSFQDYEGLLRRYVRPRLGANALAQRRCLVSPWKKCAKNQFGTRRGWRGPDTRIDVVYSKRR
jgi:Phage integrase, N-terminal SAM-like domain